jgi:hypothetical protein
VTTFLWVLVILAGLGLSVWWIVKDGIPGALPRPLDCGCTTGGAVYGCLVCGFTRCVEHRYQAHDCNEKLAR